MKVEALYLFVYSRHESKKKVKIQRGVVLYDYNIDYLFIENNKRNSTIIAFDKLFLNHLVSSRFLTKCVYTSKIYFHDELK